MGNRGSCRDPFLQFRAKIPSQAAIKKFKELMRISRGRHDGHPKMEKSPYQIFREESGVQKRVDAIMDDLKLTAAQRKERGPQLFREQFFSLASRPQEMEVWNLKAEKDHERYARELKTFMVKQKTYDMANGIAPIPYESTEKESVGHESSGEDSDSDESHSSSDDDMVYFSEHLRCKFTT